MLMLFESAAGIAKLKFSLNTLINFELFACLAVLFLVLLSGEILQRNHKIGGEVSRKFTHIFTGITLVISASFLSASQLLLICMMLLVGIFLAETTVNLIHSVDTVKRKSIGTYLYPLGIGIVLFVSGDLQLFKAVTMQMALADGFAALIGSRWGRKRYHVLGGDKSYLGSFAYFAFSLAIFIGFGYNLGVAIIVAIVGTGLEAMLAYGLDNLALPLLSALIISQL
jgi:phytol kinase